MTLNIAEGDPTTWPAGPDNLTAAAAAIAPEIIWRRIEGWIAYRFGARACVFTVEGGCRPWRPPLAPFTTTAVEAWDGATWAAVTLDPDPLGVWLGTATHYRFAGVLGTDEIPPADVLEAYRRLAEFMAAEASAHPAYTSYSIEIGSLKESFVRPSAWLARAMQSSGAADLLRAYRRAP